MRTILIFSILLLSGAAQADASLFHHRLSVALDPLEHRLKVEDIVTLPADGPARWEFDLHAGLNPEVTDASATLERLGGGDAAVPFERFRLVLPPGKRKVSLRYGGVIHHPLDAFGEGVGRNRQQTPGVIGEDGVLLSGVSGWYPVFAADQRVTFDLRVAAPGGWSSVSQGARERRGDVEIWREGHPQDTIYLLAGRFTRFERDGDVATAMVYLRQPDQALAQRYLDATDDYLRLFSSLMGEYPYAKFALVENFWETGYGMPSFTLLGPRVIRLPFILGSSYPHEIVHNWWGNGVYVDYERGNWSEGLTAYMADHLLKEREGKGAEYRRDQLHKVAEYVSGARDFPLNEFVSRHSGASQAIGYGKGMFLFHILRREVGDRTFLHALRRFYREHRFSVAGWDPLQDAFEAESGRDLAALFRQWVARPGAPRLRLADAAFGDGVTLTLEQTQAEAPFRLNVPVALGTETGSVTLHTVALEGRRTTVELSAPDRITCVSVDPLFDVYRSLLPGELPVSIDRLLSRDDLLLVVPAGAPEPLRGAYRRLAAAWADGADGLDVAMDSALAALPKDRPVWLLGWSNRFAAELLGARGIGAEGDVKLPGSRRPRENHGFVVTSQPEGAAARALLAADSPAMITALARKVPHYGKYGYLAFEGDTADNRAKGQWPVTDSPLTRHRPGFAGDCSPPPRTPLARLAE